VTSSPALLGRLEACTIRNVTHREPSGALDFQAARQIVIDTLYRLAALPPVEQVPLESAHGRVLAEPCRADRDYPSVARSLRDGFAIQAADSPGEFIVTGELRAGEAGGGPSLLPGQALEIMTGAPIPDGADAVVMVEHVTRIHVSRTDVGSRISVDRQADRGQWINPRGTEAQAGSELIPARTRLDAAGIAALAMAGAAQVKVFSRPRVAILATGDELVEVGQNVLPHQIRNSNSYALAALVSHSGALPTILPLVRDEPGPLRSALERGISDFDLMLVTGGVSAGKYDLVKPVLAQIGAHFLFERVRVQPGQPTAFGIALGRPVFGLPGNPGSTIVTYLLFADAAIRLLAGERTPILPILEATLEAPFRHKLGLTRFLPARLSTDGKSLHHIPWQGSSDVPALARANAFLIADHDRESWQIGDRIRVIAKP
jgi:molybdopterin molybdotransferase